VVLKNVGKQLRCARCSGKVVWSPPDFSCQTCGGRLSFKNLRYRRPSAKAGSGVWAYARSLPLAGGVSLGEGGTALISARSAEVAPRRGALHFKLECSNPTGSFKDRGSAVVTAAAERYGYGAMVIASTGNAGSSTAAYAARLGLQLVVLAPEWISIKKLWQIKFFGAEIRRVAGDFGDAERAYRTMVGEGWFPAGSDNPFRAEGSKTLAYEIAEQAPLGRVDRVLLPIGTGNLLVSAHKGFAELVEAGALPRMPVIDGVQLECVRPLEAQVEGVADGPPPRSVALGICISRSLLAEEALAAIRSAGGAVRTVCDDEVVGAQRDLARFEGIAAEPTGAVAFAAYRSGVARGLIGPDEQVVVPITGHLLKQPEQVIEELTEPSAHEGGG
jgi:threonine synthase